jgi:hypothetical protein
MQKPLASAVHLSTVTGLAASDTITPPNGFDVMAVQCQRETGLAPNLSPKSNFHCNIRASFAAAFRTWRIKNNIPLKKIAKDLGLSVATIDSWELGKRFPTGYNFEMLVNYTGLPPCRLFCVMADKCVPADCLLALDKKP